MTCELAFDRRAVKEWQKLGHTIRKQFKKKLSERRKIHEYPQQGYMAMLTVTKSRFVHLVTDLYIKSLMKKSFYSLLPLEEGRAAKFIRSQICADPAYANVYLANANTRIGTGRTTASPCQPAFRSVWGISASM